MGKIIRRKITICLLLLVVGIPMGHAQIPDIPIPKYEYDTTYVVNFDNLLALRFVSPRRVYDFRLKNTDTNNFLGYRPNLQSAFGLGLTYRWLAFDVVFNPRWNKQKTEKLGVTKEFNVKASLYLKRDLIDLVYRRYQGLHISNPEDFLDPWDGIYPYRADIINQNLSVTYTVPFNYKKYALRTSFLVDGRLKKSAGSVVYSAAFHIVSMKADSSIVPVELANNYDEYAQISSYGFFLLQNTFGYAYTFIYRKFYLTLSATPGLSLNLGSVQSDAGKYSPVSATFMIGSRNGIGYNSRKWYAGFYVNYKYQSIRLQENLNLNSNLGEIRFFIGYRIHAPYVVNSIIRE